MGEPGYDKLIELFTWLEQNKQGFNAVQELWRHEEMFMGRFFRSLNDHHEDVLRFGLYLQKKTDASGAAREISDELFKEEMGTILLGFYGGNDPEVYSGYLSLFRQQLAGDLQKTRHADDMIRSLSQIPSQEATGLLLDLLGRSQGSVLVEVVRSLAWQGSDRALPALRELQQSTTDQGLLSVIEAAIRYLE